MGEIYLAKLWKRVIASLLDYGVVFALAITFYMFLSNGIIDIGFHNASLKQEQFKLQEKSHLFDVTKENETISQVKLLEFDEKDINSYKSFLNAIHDFYYDFLTLDNKSNENLNKEYFLFDENKLENAIFKIENINDSIEDFILKDEIVNIETLEKVSKNDTEKYIETISLYFLSEEKGVYNLSLTYFTNTEEFKNIDLNIAYVERIEIMFSMLFSSLIVFAFPLLFNKNGETLFMHFLKLGYSNRNGYKVNFALKIIRLVVTLTLNTISMYLYLIPFLINILFLFITKEKRSLIDIASGMVAIDMVRSTIYQDYEEMKKDEK